MIRHLAVFEVRLEALDLEARTVRGRPFPSRVAHDALRIAVDEFEKVIKQAGLTIVHAGYGVRAEKAE